MPIASQTLHTLEFPKICEQLARHTAFSASRELALDLQPSTDIHEVRQRQELTGEARTLIDDVPDLTIGGARDVRRAARHADRGGILDGQSLLEIAATLTATHALRARLTRLDPTLFPLLVEQATFLPNLPHLEAEITRAIGDDGEVLDSASSELAHLRREIRIAFGRLQEKLQNLISSSTYASALQEPIITVRNGRYVIPVKASHRKDVRGLVHDQSSSGATLYIEPMAVLELNNRWREMQAAEAEEVQRILAALSQLVASNAPQIVAAVETLASIDLALAAARYACALRAVRPEIVEIGAGMDAPLFLTEARHPLLDSRTVVPTSIWLGGDFRLLLITGPNTGGKTVALKTTGLLALMAQAGLQVPASLPARIPVFGHIFADIGDEQSIEQSLSTFSSHMSNIIRVLRALEEPEDWAAQPPLALVLLDELGAGTDPVEGAALARAIIERLLELQVFGVATTHYAELKAFAYNTPGVQNASVEFDIETLAPTYRLSIGLPGRSNALAIASRLGLSAELVERARSTITREAAQIEDLLAGIHHEREAAAAEIRRAEELRADSEKYRDRLAAELREFEAQREAEIEAAHQELEDELREVRGQLRRLRDEFRSVSLSRQWLEEAEQRMAEAGSQAKAVMAKQAKPKPAQPAQTGPRPLQPGDTVMVRSVGLKGEIVSIDAEEGIATVQCGGFRMNVSLRELSREKGNPNQSAQRTYTPAARSVNIPPAHDVAMTFDMRGWRAHDVADKLDRYLNDAYLAGLHQVRLLHGKGTGALRQVVRDVLQGHPLIASFHSAAGRDGGDGVTVANLVER